MPEDDPTHDLSKDIDFVQAVFEKGRAMAHSAVDQLFDSPYWREQWLLDYGPKAFTQLRLSVTMANDAEGEYLMDELQLNSDDFEEEELQAVTPITILKIVEDL